MAKQEHRLGYLSVKNTDLDIYQSRTQTWISISQEHRLGYLSVKNTDLDIYQSRTQTWISISQEHRDLEIILYLTHSTVVCLPLSCRLHEILKIYICLHATCTWIFVFSAASKNPVYATRPHLFSFPLEAVILV